MITPAITTGSSLALKENTAPGTAPAWSGGSPAPGHERDGADRVSQRTAAAERGAVPDQLRASNRPQLQPRIRSAGVRGLRPSLYEALGFHIVGKENPPDGRP